MRGKKEEERSGVRRPGTNCVNYGRVHGTIYTRTEQNTVFLACLAGLGTDSNETIVKKSIDARWKKYKKCRKK